MLVKIAQLGARVVEVSLKSGSVDDALTTAGISSEGYVMYVGGFPVNRTHFLEDGDTIILVRASGIRGEATVKVAGDIWRIHQNDPDEIFPSNFHAHNEIGSETLDLYTGRVFDPRTKQFKRKLPKKQLDTLYQKLPKKLL